MSPVTIFLRNGQVFALTVDKPEMSQNDSYCEVMCLGYGADEDCRCVAYKKELASARESAVRVENAELNCAGGSVCHIKLVPADYLLRIEEGQFYQLPSEYKMRVHVLPDRATIYRDEPKAIETPLSALRNKLGPFINLAEIVKDVRATDLTGAMIGEASRCDTEEVHRLLSELEELMTRKEGVTH